MSLEEMDSALYALALQEFNLFKHQPQPPGYLFYIWAARLAQRWVHDPVQALATVQTVSGILVGPAVLWSAAAVHGPRVGVELDAPVGV
jgi:hypothetical protein